MCLALFGAQTTKIKTDTIPTLGRTYTYSLRDKNYLLHRSNLIYYHLDKYIYYTKLALGKVTHVNNSQSVIYQNVSLNFSKYTVPSIADYKLFHCIYQQLFLF